MSLLQSERDVSLDKLYSMLRNLFQQQEMPDEAWLATIRQKAWVLRSYMYLADDEKLSTTANELLNALEGTSTRENSLLVEKARRISDRIFEIHGDRRQVLDPALGFSSIQALVTTISTLVAILIGNSGLFAFLEKATSNKPGVTISSTSPSPQKSQPDTVDSRILLPLHLTHTLVVAGLSIVLFTNFGPRFPAKWPDLSAPESQRIVDGVLWQFSRGWTFIWITFFLRYALAATEQYLLGKSAGNESIMSELAHTGTEFVNLLNTLGFYWCFLCLDVKSVSTAQDEKRNRPFLRGMEVVIVVGVLLTVLTLYFHFSGKPDLGITKTILAMFDAVGIAFLVGRLDSHYLSIPRSLLALLYAYAALQFASAFMESMTPQIVVTLYILALTMKVVLFITIIQFGQPENLKRYLERVARDLTEASGTAAHAH